ncbi:MAG: hypothetical protein GWN64_11120, partial [Candidatus Thorarchaeota archaeon]|nr:hypothetical protein [Candidatus Thorarchaeota archaeon]
VILASINIPNVYVELRRLGLSIEEAQKVEAEILEYIREDSGIASYLDMLIVEAIRRQEE